MNQFPQPINGASMAEVSSVSIPYLYYPIPPYMSNLYFEYTPSFDGFTRTYQCTIPTNVNYSLASFVAALNASLVQSLVIASNSVPSDVGAIDDLSQKIIFSLNASSAPNGNKISFEVTFPGDTMRFVPYGYDRNGPYFHNLSFRVGYGLAQDAGTPYTNTAGFVAANGLNAWSFPSLLRTPFFMIQADFSSADSFCTTQNRYNILAKVIVPPGTQQGELVQYKAFLPNPFTIRNLPVSFQSMSFVLIDAEGEVMTDGPRAGDGSISLEILIRYDEAPKDVDPYARY
jgi:hypothetical protein